MKNWRESLPMRLSMREVVDLLMITPEELRILAEKGLVRKVRGVRNAPSGRNRKPGSQHTP
jgi:hypothetical protein